MRTVKADKLISMRAKVRCRLDYLCCKYFRSYSSVKSAIRIYSLTSEELSSLVRQEIFLAAQNTTCRERLFTKKRIQSTLKFERYNSVLPEYSIPVRAISCNSE